MQLTLSLIICTLNNSEGIKCVLECVAKQNLRPNEIIIVQGGTNYITSRIVKEWELELNITYVESQKSLVKQRNNGIELANGDIICFLDDDVILEENYFEAILKAYKNDINNDIGGVQGTILNSPKGKKLKNLFNKIFMLEENFGNGKLKRSGAPSFHPSSPKQVEVEVFNGCLMTFRTELLKKIKFADFFENYWLGDDFETSYSVSTQKKLIQIPDARLTHIGNASFSNSAKTAFMIGRNYPYIRQKHNLDKGIGRVYCLWSDFGRIIFYFFYGIKKMQLDYLLAWIDGRNDYYKSKISIDHLINVKNIDSL